ncbi:MAG TPA: hypothetical protein VF572_04295 [Candidatus Saccharimonadales bacterium]|jgi:hypothetical protein
MYKIKPASRKKLPTRLALPLQTVIVILAAVLYIQFQGMPSAITANSVADNRSQQSVQKANPADAQKAARAQVDDNNGRPQSGRDPAFQQQSSLASAASAPTGAGMRTDKPAAGVKGGHDHRVDPSQVRQDPMATGVNSAGCYIDYGRAGDQCLPAGISKGTGTVKCEEVRKRFAEGLKVTGTDRFRLDSNGDGTACGAGDR